MDISEHLRNGPVDRPHDRAIHRIDPIGYETVDYRPPLRGELFADCKGAAAWIYFATGNHRSPQRIVKPSTKELSYP